MSLPGYSKQTSARFILAHDDITKQRVIYFDITGCNYCPLLRVKQLYHNSV